jgi:hypothetical protein
MKRLLLIAGVLVLCSTALYSQDLACPISITDVRSVAGNMKVLFRNASQTEITEYEFVVWFVDFDEQTHFIPAVNPVPRKIKAGRSAAAVYSAPETLDYTFSAANAYLLHVTFADGNVWNDDGSHGCRLSALQE